MRSRAIPARALLAGIALACLAPFLDKAFHVDDPLFLWSAQQIHADPTDFYGFAVNWHGYADPMYRANQNPPLVAFYLALVAALLGWSEPALHLGMALPAVAAVLGVHALARRTCAEPRVAALAALATPALLVASTSLMVDVSMLALWCWSLVLWIDGLERGDRARWRYPVGAGLLAGLALLTKYTAVALVPLLLAYGLVRARGPGRWIAALAIPLLLAAGYRALLLARYGHDPLGAVPAYALASRAATGVDPLAKGAVALLFLGGAMLPVLCYAPLLWSRRALGAGAGLALLGAAALSRAEALGPLPLHGGGAAAWGAALQVALLAACGVQVLALAALEGLRGRSAQSLLLALWVAGVFAFAAFVNWTTNARTLLPAVPAVAILLCRRIERRRPPGGDGRRWRLYAPLGPAFAAALAVAWADARHANSARDAAAAIAEKYSEPGRRLWFQGGWGFQYYLERAGGVRVDGRDALLAPGDLLAVPGNGTNLWTPPAGAVVLREELRLRAARWITTMHEAVGAGFHSERWGPLPFYVGPAPEERYRIFEMRRHLQLRGSPSP